MKWHHAQWIVASRRAADVAILTWDASYASLVPALLRARTQGVGVILWGHGYSQREAPWRLALRNRIGHLANAVMVYNHRTAQRLVESGLPPDRVHVALNALDQAPIQAARRSRLERPDQLARFRQDHGLRDRRLLLFVSRHRPGTHLDLLIDALASLKSRYADLLAVMIGGGGEHIETLRRHAAERGVEHMVRFLGPIYDQNQLAPWFLVSTLFAFPANIGLSILHAMGYGLPVITCDDLDSQGPEIEALEHGVNGLLYRQADADALAAAISRLLDDPTERNRMAANAHRTATERFTLQHMVDGIERAVRFAARDAQLRIGDRQKVQNSGR